MTESKPAKALRKGDNYNLTREARTDLDTKYGVHHSVVTDRGRAGIFSVALAGFRPEEISLTAEQNVLTLEGQKAEKDSNKVFLFRGISTRPFKRQFTLADHVEVRSARFEDGSANLTLSEKHAILASWASDAAAVASCPALRAPPELSTPVTIDEILEALRELDGGPPLPPGGKAQRIGSTDRTMAA